MEYENDYLYDIWNIDLKLIDLETNDFTLVQNEDYFKLKNFIDKLNLNLKLKKSLQDKDSKINSLRKI